MARPRAAVLGSPISHSLSPLLHRAAYRALGLDWTYEAIELTPDLLDGFLQEFRADPNWRGLSVTMPLKERALELSDRHASVCGVTAAANTLTKSEENVVADNTDPIGIRFALERVGITSLRDVTVCIIGAGATARSALYAVWELGGGMVNVIARRQTAIDDLASSAESMGISVAGHSWSDGPILDFGLVISVVPAGIADGCVALIPEAPGALLDVVYAPWPSALTQAWGEAGGVVADGLDMLVGQAARQVTLMTGMTAPVDAMLQAAESTRR